MKHWHLFLAFFRSGMLGYGGGPSSIPLVHREVVEKYGWMNDDEFADVLALGNALPGPIITKMGAYIGYRVAGTVGAAIAVLASTMPTILLMIVLLSLLASFKDQPWVAGMTRAVGPVVGVMLAVLAYDFLKKSIAGLGKAVGVVMLAVSFLVLQVLHIHVAILLAALLVFAIFKPADKRPGKKEKERGMDA